MSPAPVLLSAGLASALSLRAACCCGRRQAGTNGIGTLVFGNCGCGFAPCLAEDRPFLAEIMEGVEEIPKAALDGTPESIARGGMEWSWETMLEFMDVVEKNDLALDVACYVPHGALRTYVMGPRGADHLSIPTDDDIKAMQMVVKQAVQAGALGVGSNRVGGHSDLSGNPVPGSFAPMNEIEALADAIREAGGGIFEFVTEGLMDETLRTAPAERAMFQRITTTEEDGGFVGTCFNFHPRRPEYNESMREAGGRANWGPGGARHSHPLGLSHRVSHRVFSERVPAFLRPLAQRAACSPGWSGSAPCARWASLALAPVRAHPGLSISRNSPRTAVARPQVSHSTSSFYGAFVWRARRARRALNC